MPRGGCAERGARGRRRREGRPRRGLVVAAGPLGPSEGEWGAAAGRARRWLGGLRGRTEAWVGRRGGLGAWATPAVASALVFAALDVGRFASSLKGDSLARWDELVQRDRSSSGLGKASEPTVVYDVRGRVVASFSSEAPIALSEVAAPVWKAIVASEDHRFFKHRGVDVRGLLRAAISLGSRGGGSTITQQLCKNMVFSPERTITRKLVEVFSALVLESKLTKEEILEEYLNNVYWGHGIYGIKQAAATYFRKRPADLNAGEAALLAALLPSPERYSPFRNPKAAARAQAQVISRMVDTGNLEESEVRLCIGLPPSLANIPRGGARTVSAMKDTKGSGAPYRAPFFVSEVLHQLRDLHGDALNKGGLQIHTTLDLALQEHAEVILRKDGGRPRLGENRGEASLVACEPSSGAVRVLVGGRDYSKSTYNRAVNASRCPGSAFKPFVYLAALETGMVTPGTEVQDEAVVFKREGAGWTAESLDHKEKQRKARAKDLAEQRAKVQQKMEAQKKDYEKKAEARSELQREKLGELQRLRNRLKSRSSAAPGSKTEEGMLEASLMGAGRPPTLVNKILALEDELDELMNFPEFLPDEALLQEDIVLQEMAEESSESEDSDREEYQPFNYSRKYRGTVTLKTSLSDSLNIPTLKLANLIGIDKVVQMSHKLGIRSELPGNLSLALGACEVTPLEMASAYNTIAAGGVYSRPHFITHVKDCNGKVIFRHKPARRRACGSSACADLHRMLRAAVMDGTASKALSGWPSSAAAGKTGTSDDYRDAWYGGYTPSLSCVVWVGRDDNSPLPGTGSTLALPVWAEFMRAGHGAGVSAEKGTSRRRVSRWRLKEAW